MKTKTYSNEREVVEVHIGMGLPGSGKTTYFQNLAPEHGVTTQDGVYKTRIDMDRMLRDKRFKRAVTTDGKLDVERLFDYCTNLGCSMRKAVIVLDGLFLQKDSVLDIVRQLCKLGNQTHFNQYNYDYHVIIDQWEEDRDQCLANDLFRDRENKASYTICNAPYEPFKDITELEQFIKMEGSGVSAVFIEWHKIAVPEDWQLYTKRPGRPEDARYMYSDSWSLGGTCGSYTGSIETVSPEDPKENEALDQFLEEHAPSISMLQYKKLVRECVTLETREEHDYYGGETRESFYKTDMKLVYELLNEWGLLK